MSGQREWVGWVAGGVVLAGFALWQLWAPNGDLYQYRCFALAFWHGSAGSVGAAGCAVRLPAAPFPPFHVLPREYPPLALLVFSAPLLLGGAASMTLYVLAFNALMLACLGGTAWLLRGVAPADTVGRRAAGWYILWLALGSTTIALVRFDAVLAILTIAAVVWARRGPSRGAYVLLALGGMLKLYPLLVLVLLAVWDWRRTAAPNPLPGAGSRSQKPQRGEGKPDSARRWLWLVGPASGAAVVVAIQLVADALSGASGVPWLAVQAGRPPQIESTPAGLLWLVEVILGRGGQVHAVGSGFALALTAAPGGVLADVTTGLAVVAIACAAWAVATARVRPSHALAGSLLALLAGATIFSPQYLIWATPLVALALADMGAGRAEHAGPEGAARRGRQIAWGWSLVCALTSLMYSVGYLEGWPRAVGWALAPFMILVLLRDLLVWGVAVLLLIPAAPARQGQGGGPAAVAAWREMCYTPGGASSPRDG